MCDGTIHGRVVTEDQIEEWAEEAEHGYDLSQLPPPLAGCPTFGNGAEPSA